MIRKNERSHRQHGIYNSPIGKQFSPQTTRFSDDVLLLVFTNIFLKSNPSNNRALLATIQRVITCNNYPYTTVLLVSCVYGQCASTCGHGCAILRTVVVEVLSSLAHTREFRGTNRLRWQFFSRVLSKFSLPLDSISKISIVFNIFQLS